MTTPLPTDKIEAILERQEQIANDLLTLLADEKEAMSAMDVERLLSLSFKKEQRLRTMLDLDRALQTAVRVVAGNTTDKILRLPDLKPFLSSNKFSTLSEAKKKLAAMREEIFSRTAFNRKLAEEMQLFIKDAMSLITGSRTKPTTYGNGGRSIKGGSMGPSLISREV
jgi:flagellar biosynthesis/type III secretory pathway chaperone